MDEGLGQDVQQSVQETETETPKKKKKKDKSSTWKWNSYICMYRLPSIMIYIDMGQQSGLMYSAWSASYF